MLKKIDNLSNLLLNSKYFTYSYLLFFFIAPHLKFLNLRLNIFDTGLYTSNLYSIFKIENINGLFIGHAQLILYPISFIFLFTEKYAINFLLILQSLCLISPIFFLKKNSEKVIYLIFFPIWYINFNGFHIDSLIVPIIFLYLSSNNNKKYFLLILMVLIKEIFIILALSLLVFELYKTDKKKNNLYFILIFLGVVFFIIFQIILSEIQGQNYSSLFQLIFNFNNIAYLFSLFNFTDYSLFSFLKKIFFMLLIFVPFKFINFKNKKFYFLYFPIFLIYFLLDNINFLKPYFHYSTFLIPILFVICLKELINSKKNIAFYLLINLAFTINFFNPIFYFQNINFTKNYNLTNYKNYQNYQKLDNFLKDINIPNEEAITVSNNLLHYKIVNRNFILVPDYSPNLDNAFTACRNLNNNFDILNTKKCKIFSKYVILNNKDFKKYNEILVDTKKFKIIKKSNEFTFYRS